MNYDYHCGVIDAFNEVIKAEVKNLALSHPSSKEEIEQLEQKHNEAPHLREAHKALAKEVISFIHGEEAYNEAIKISNALFSGNIKELTADQIAMGFSDLPKAVAKELTLCDTLIELKLASSRREAREFIRNGAVLVNGEKLTSYLADVDDFGDYAPETEVIKDGYFHESEYRSAPYFDLRIDGITLLNEKY